MSEESLTPPEIREIAQSTVGNLLPNKSRHLYEKVYEQFEDWCKEKQIHAISENVLLAYFELQKSKYKASTLWTTYSKLRSCLNIYKNVDISKYNKLQALLKRASQGYVPKKSSILEEEDINRFIKEADDKIYLAMKVILLMGYHGALRREELTNMSVDDIEYKSDVIVVTVPKTKNNVPRTFVITDDQWINIIKKYANLRPKKVTHKRFFLTYRNGYCINSPIGINIMGKVSKNIATFLNLPNPERYTGHCFRRSSATHLANRGGDLLTLKRHGGWKSSAIAEGYVDASLKQKIQVARMFESEQTNPNLPGCSSAPQDCRNDTTKINSDSNLFQNFVATNLPGINLSAQDTSNVTLNIYNNCTFQGKNLLKHSFTSFLES